MMKMNYVSTRDTSVKVSSSQAITRGISADGGLFVPESFPSVSLERIEQLSKLDYIGRAKAILSLSAFLPATVSRWGSI